MPTYGYVCKSCNYTFDVVQSMRDDPLKVCPKCGKEIRRIINGGNGIIFKGKGFYITDKNDHGGPSGNDEKAVASLKETHEKTVETGSAPSPCANCPNSESPAYCPKAAS